MAQEEVVKKSQKLDRFFTGLFTERGWVAGFGWTWFDWVGPSRTLLRQERYAGQARRALFRQERGGQARYVTPPGKLSTRIFGMRARPKETSNPEHRTSNVEQSEAETLRAVFDDSFHWFVVVDVFVSNVESFSYARIVRRGVGHLRSYPNLNFCEVK
jgi:hypothetical protein